MSNLKNHVNDCMYTAFAEGICIHIDSLIQQKIEPTNKIVDELFNELIGKLIRDEGYTYFNLPATIHINNMFKKVIDFIPKFDTLEIYKITDLFHFLEFNFKSNITESTVTSYRAFEPNMLFDLFMSDKVSKSALDYLIKKTLYGNSSGAICTHELLLDNSLFKDKHLKHQLLLMMVNSVNNDQTYNNWIERNSTYLTNVVYEEDAYELGIKLFLIALDSPESRYGKDMPDSLKKLFTYMCGSLENYNKMCELENALGCSKIEKSFWIGALNKSSGISQTLTQQNIEF